MKREEIWRAVVGYEGLYEVSSLGRIRSLDRKIQCLSGQGKLIEKALKGVIRKAAKEKNGYLKVTLGKKGVIKSHWVHILVARAFFGERPKDQEVCHRDGNSTNNAKANLRYGTRSSNQDDRVMHGTSNRGEQQGHSILTREKVEEIFRLRAEGVKQKDIAALVGCSRQGVYAVTSGRTWRWFSDML